MNRLCAVVELLDNGESITFVNNGNGKFTTGMLVNAINSEYNKLKIKPNNNIIIRKQEATNE
jgi:hypothetical protein